MSLILLLLCFNVLFLVHVRLRRRMQVRLEHAPVVSIMPSPRAREPSFRAVSVAG